MLHRTFQIALFSIIIVIGLFILFLPFTEIITVDGSVTDFLWEPLQFIPKAIVSILCVYAGTAMTLFATVIIEDMIR